MVKKHIASLSVLHCQYLDEQGQLLPFDQDVVAQKITSVGAEGGEAYARALSEDAATLTALYRAMIRTRIFDKKAVALQRTGHIGTFPSSLGQEAICVGMGHSLEKTDVFCPYYREQGTLLMRGVCPEELYRYWGGDERGNCYRFNAHDLPINVPIASQCLHAAGVAYAMAYRQQKRVVMTVCGDGATSKGDFYEALNVAGVAQLPVVFVINNNQWAISVSREKQTAAQTLAQKAWAAQIPACQVDGNDIIAVCAQLHAAVAAARQGHGPQLIEMLTYRLADHTTADDAARYVPRASQQAAWEKEPVLRLKRYLMQVGHWSEKAAAAWQARCEQEMHGAAARYLATPAQDPADLFDYLYACPPRALMDQKAQFLAQLSAKKPHHRPK